MPLGSNEGLQAQLLHQPLDGLVVDRLACLAQHSGDTAIAIASLVVIIDRLDARLQRRIQIAGSQDLELVVERAAR